MNALEAIAKAKQHVAEMFQDESISNIGLEEIEFIAEGDQWRVTIGFARPWDQPLGIAATMGGRRGRTFKVVAINDRDGEVISVKHREPAFSD